MQQHCHLGLSPIPSQHRGLLVLVLVLGKLIKAWTCNFDSALIFPESNLLLRSYCVWDRLLRGGSDHAAVYLSQGCQRILCDLFLVRLDGFWHDCEHYCSKQLCALCVPR
jgi:hypothetical protein